MTAIENTAMPLMFREWIRIREKKLQKELLCKVGLSRTGWTIIRDRCREVSSRGQELPGRL